jgi:outer membrane protein OmpA-like peptidoglycan-associated protein
VSKGKLLAVCIVWLLVFAALAAAYRILIYPRHRNRLLSGTGSSSHYRLTVDFALDSFSGYAILRSPEFHDQLAQKRIRMNLVDDGADYVARIEAIKSGNVQLAVFTIDALLKVSDSLDDLPATIVAIVDETRGADAIVAYKNAVPNVDALNRADMRFVLTPDSPSETLARVVMSHFNLDRLETNPFRPVQDAEAVYRLYRTAKPETPQAFVLWEPFVSKVLENPNTHIVADSSRFRGYIVDVIVVNRDFLLKSEDFVREIIGCYFRAAYHYRDSMVELTLEDAKLTGTPLSRKQAQNLVNGIWWKNTQENFAHFDLPGTGDLQLLEDIVDNVSRVLLTTGAIERNPIGGRAHTLFYDKILKHLQASDFHPGLAEESVRDEPVQLKDLSDEEWLRLTPLGTLDVPQLVFARGTDRLTINSRAVLDDLVQALNSFPQTYVLIRGNASTRGNTDANMRLAESRAKAAETYLINAGIDENRVRAVGVEPSGEMSVSFVLGQEPY